MSVCVQIAQAPINEPTWTGRHGGAGAPAAQGAAARRFGKVAAQRPAAAAAPARAGAGGGGAGLSAAGGGSASVLAQLRARQQQLDGPAARGSRAGPAAAAAGPAGPAAGGAAADVSAQRLAAEIVSYLQEEGGANKEVEGSKLVAAFRSRVNSDQKHVFQQLLAQVAVLNRRTGGSFWKLKREFWNA